MASTFAAAALACVAGIAAERGAGVVTKAGCVRCHSIANRGGSLGPDLNEIGLRRTPESLRLSITDPDSEIAREYLTVVVTTKHRQRIEGVALNEDDLSIQLRDTDGNPRSFRKENLKEVRREQRSLMPSYAAKPSADEIDSLVAYLHSLKGSIPPPRQRKIGPLTTSLEWLTRANRDAEERPEMLLDSLQIPRRATVVDLGAGAGYFTWRLAQRVGPQGKVIAVNIQQSMLDLARNRWGNTTSRTSISSVACPRRQSTWSSSPTLITSFHNPRPCWPPSAAV